MSFLVAGATGAVGHCVVQDALSESFATDVRRVVALTRQTVSAKNPVEKIFRFPEMEGTSSPFDKDKLNVVAFDWDRFLAFWKKFSQTSLKEQRMMEILSVWSSSTMPKADQKEDIERNFPSSNNVDSAVNVFIGGLSSTLIDSFHELQFEQEITFSFWEVKAEYEYYKKIFSSHEYAAICLGSTRKETTNKHTFVCCNFSYLVAFTEALLCFSAPAGWHVLAEEILPPLISKKVEKKLFKEEQQQRHQNESSFADSSESAPAIWGRSPTWLQFRVGPPTTATSKNSILQSPKVVHEVLAYYSQEQVQRNVVPLLFSRSSQSLKGITLISSNTASVHSKLLYRQTKGALECALAERILLHNKLLEKQLSDRPGTSSTSPLAPLHYNVLRLGLLNRESMPSKEYKVLDSLALHAGLKAKVVGSAVLKNYRWCRSFFHCSLAEILEKYPAARRYPDRKTFEKICEPFFWFNSSDINILSKTTPFDPFTSEQL